MSWQRMWRKRTFVVLRAAVSVMGKTRVGIMYSVQHANGAGKRT
jgi:hypothetical protein